jgi:hypothetical protein
VDAGEAVLVLPPVRQRHCAESLFEVGNGGVVDARQRLDPLGAEADAAGRVNELAGTGVFSGRLSALICAWEALVERSPGMIHNRSRALRIYSLTVITPPGGGVIR